MTNLDNIKKYMLLTENIQAWLPGKNTVVSRNSLIDKEMKKNTKKNVLVDNTDALFWTFYCILYGEQEYEIDHSFQTEKKFKIKCIEDLRKIKPNLKTFKLKLGAIEDQLLNSKKINIQALLGLALLFKKNILYVWNRKFFEFICSEDNNIYIINNNNNEQISYDTDAIKIKYYKENFLQIENIDKPLKAASGYSKESLLAMAQKLEIKNVNLKSTKNILYQEVLQKM
jgi:hypothetical protein